MNYEPKSQIDPIKAARRYSRALQERRRCDERRAKNLALIAAVLLCFLMTTFSGSLRKTVDRHHYGVIPVQMTHLLVSR
jgi:hypothetical protein